MPSPRDRSNIAPPGALLEEVRPAYPLPPLNVFVNSTFKKGSFDIRWTDPTELQANTCFNIVGVNIYRAGNSYGPWMRLNSEPIGTKYWRDDYRIRLALQEDVSQQFVKHNADGTPVGNYIFRTRNKPIYINPSINDPNCTNINVTVTVNGVPAFVETIYSKPGIVELRHLPTFDVTGQEQHDAVFPTSPNDVVLATYKYVEKCVETSLFQKILYRITTVAIDGDGNLVETPLDRGTQSSHDDIEKLDYIWTEAIRRSKWILDQGGERVKVFLKKTSGFACGCNSDTRKQPRSDCPLCFSTGFIGGYDGPYDIIISPDDGEKSIGQTNRGRNPNHSFDSWTANEPLLSQRDFVVRQNGDRYTIGPVRSPNARGMQLLQFFSMSNLDESNIINNVPVLDTSVLVAPQTRYIIKGGGAATPMMTEKSNIGDEREVRGKTVTYENQEY